ANVSSETRHQSPISSGIYVMVRDTPDASFSKSSNQNPVTLGTKHKMKFCEDSRRSLKKSRARPMRYALKLLTALTLMSTAGCAMLRSEASSSLPAPSAMISPDVCGVLPPLTQQQNTFQYFSRLHCRV
nr:hypothetical protein [Paracoccaceae bacterium]